LSIAGWQSNRSQEGSTRNHRNLFTSDPAPAVKKKHAEISFLLFALGAGVGLIRAVNIPILVGPEMVVIAKNLAHYGTYANPSPTLNTGLTAANPPLYPLLLALFIVIFKNWTAITVAATVGNIVVSALTAAWLPRVSWLFYGDVKPGVVASCLWLLEMRLFPSWDTGYTLALLVLFCFFTATTINKDRTLRDGICAGIIAAALFLFNPSSMLVFLPWIAYLLVFREAPLKRTLGYLGITLLVFGTAAFGWALRNDLALGSFTIRTNLGTSLYASNNDCAMPSLIEEAQNDCILSRHPTSSLTEAQLTLRMGEVAYDRMRIRDAENWVKLHPARFAWLTAMRIRNFWFPPMQGIVSASSLNGFWAATFLSIPGLFLMALARQRVVLFLLAVCSIYPLLYYFVVSDDRYRYPIIWLSLLPAGYFLCWVGSMVSARWRQSSLETRPAKDAEGFGKL
jgi:hypothetical protein